MEDEIKNTSSAGKWSTKSKLVIILLVFLLLCGSYGYYWYTDIRDKGIEATAVLSENAVLKSDLEAYTRLKESLSGEYDRCQEFISQSVGDFGSFEYCKKFIGWVNSQSLSLDE